MLSPVHFQRLYISEQTMNIYMAYYNKHLQFPQFIILISTFKFRKQGFGINTGGREALRDGKSLFLSGHVKETKYHGISGNISYCFVKAKVGDTLLPIL